MRLPGPRPGLPARETSGAGPGAHAGGGGGGGRLGAVGRAVAGPQTLGGGAAGPASSRPRVLGHTPSRVPVPSASPAPGPWRGREVRPRTNRPSPGTAWPGFANGSFCYRRGEGPHRLAQSRPAAASASPGRGTRGLGSRASRQVGSEVPNAVVLRRRQSRWTPGSPQHSSGEGRDGTAAQTWGARAPRSEGGLCRPAPGGWPGWK